MDHRSIPSGFFARRVAYNEYAPLSTPCQTGASTPQDGKLLFREPLGEQEIVHAQAGHAGHGQKGIHRRATELSGDVDHCVTPSGIDMVITIIEDATVIGIDVCEGIERRTEALKTDLVISLGKVSYGIVAEIVDASARINVTIQPIPEMKEGGLPYCRLQSSAEF